MQIVSARIINTKKERLCDVCFINIQPGEKVLRLYGSATKNDRKYAIHMHPSCTVSTHWKILMAKKDLEAEHASV